MNRLLKFVLLASLALGCAACSYRLAGTPQPLPFKTIAVAQVENGSYAPQASNPLTTQLALRLSQSPGLELVGPGEADAVLEVTLDDYTKRMYASREDDTALASAITVTLRAKCTLRDRASGRVLFENVPVEVSSHIYDKNGGFINAEYQNMTTLTGELAKRIADQVLGIW